eukprot:Rmarinus@m.3450
MSKAGDNVIRRVKEDQKFQNAHATVKDNEQKYFVANWHAKNSGNRLAADRFKAMQAELRLLSREKKAMRAQMIAELYQLEMERYVAELSERGLAISPQFENLH